ADRKRGIGHRDSTHRIAGIRIPRQDLSIVCDVQGRNILAIRAADHREASSRVKGGAANAQRANGAIQCLRPSGKKLTGGRIESGQSTAIDTVYSQKTSA